MRLVTSATSASTPQARAAPPAMVAVRSRYPPFSPAPSTLAGFVGEEDGFDPLNISRAVDMRWLREAELKHGRVAM